LSLCLALKPVSQSLSLSHKHTLPLEKVRTWQLAGIDQLVFPSLFLELTTL
jgi:hypothetical protein